MVLTAALRALPSLLHPATRRMLAKTLALTLLVFAGLAVALWAGVHMLRLYLGWGGGGIAETALTTLAIFALGWLLFRAIAMAVMGLFADDIIAAVEAGCYPEAALRARSVGPARSARYAMASFGRALMWNLILWPSYIVLLLLTTGVGTIGLFLIVNAYLLGRDLADMVEPRHPGQPPIPRGSRWLMGLVSALLFLVPLVNLLAPIWSAAMAVHMLHGVRRKPV